MFSKHIRFTSNRYFLSTVLIFTIGLFSTCKKVDLDKIKNLNNGKIYIIGHGGVGFFSQTNPLPENSFTSIKNAIEGQNADGVEVDVQMSVDKKLILYHDNKLETSTNCSDCISDNLSTDLLACKYFVGNSFSLTNEKLISLEQVLARFFTRKIKPLIFLDTKFIEDCRLEGEDTSDKFSDMLEEINRLIELYDAAGWVHVMSPSIEFLILMKSINPEVKLWLDGSNFSINVPLAKQHQIYGVSGSNANISKEDISFAHENKLFALLFGMKSQSGIVRAIEKYPDYLQTDNILLTQKILLD